MNTSKEKWIRIYDDYKVSDKGRVVSLKSNTILKPHKDKDGYLQLYISFPIKKIIKVHTLVMQAFFGKRPEGYVTNHKNGIKQDNRLENLEYITPYENEQHAVRHKLKAWGERHHCAKMTEEMVRNIRIRHRNGESTRKIAKSIAISQTSVSHAICRRTWRNLD